MVRMYRCCCKDPYIEILIIIITFPYSTCISFFGSSIPTLFNFKMFFRSLRKNATGDFLLRACDCSHAQPWH